ERHSTRGSQQPACRFGIRAGPRLEVGSCKQNRSDAQQGTKIAGVAKIKDVPIVAVPDHRRGAAFAQGSQKLHHPLETCPVCRGEVVANLARNEPRQEKKLKHEDVISHRLFATPAVWVCLSGNLFTKDLSALPTPAAGLLQLSKIHSGDKPPGALADPMVVGGRATRIFPRSLPQVEVDRMSQAVPKLPRH